MIDGQLAGRTGIVRAVLAAIVVACLQWITPLDRSDSWVEGRFAVAALLLVPQVAPLLVRHKYPVAVWTAVAGGYVLGSLVAAVAVPFCAALALFNVIARVRSVSRMFAAVAVGSAAVTAFLAALTVGSGQYRSSDFSGIAVLWVAAVFLGWLLRVRRGREEALARVQVSVVQQAWAQRRLSIARDMHDLVGHGLSTIAVQSSTARMALEAGDLETARAAITAVETGSRSTMRGVRDLLTVLREEGEDRSRPLNPTPGIADLDELVADLRRTGVVVQLNVDRQLCPPPDVALCVYRVVQEALTNAVKYAPGAPASVRVWTAGDEVRVEVRDEGFSSALDASVGNVGLGLRGMRERVEVLGGSLVAGRDGRGWLVRAVLPLTEGKAQ